MEFRKKEYASFDIFDSEWAVITVKRQLHTLEVIQEEMKTKYSAGRD